MKSEIKDPYYESLYRLLLRNVDGKQKKILVMGTHAGRDTETLLSVYPRLEATILEPILSFIVDYEAQFKGRSNVQIAMGKWEEMSSFEEKFDLAVCLDGIEHSKRPYRIVDNLTKYSDEIIISCPNGFWFFKDGHRYVDHGHGPHISQIKRSEIRKFLKDRGYEINILAGVRKRWLGPFSFGTFVRAVKK